MPIDYGQQMDHDEEYQATLIENIFHLTTFTVRRARLAAIVTEISPRFFPLLSSAIDEGRTREADGLALSEELLEAAGCLDLRDEWGRQERLIIWGAAWFAQRHTFFRVLIEDERPQPLSYEKLQDWVRTALYLAQRQDRPKLGLAMLNVLLAVSPRAVGGWPLEAKADTLRYEVVTAGVGIIVSQWLGVFRTTAKRLFREAEALFEQIAAQPMDGFRRLTLNLSAIDRLYLAGDLAQAGGNPQEAIRIYQQALQQGEALREHAAEVPGLTATDRRVGLCVPNTLWRLAKAKILAWRLDEASVHIERAIDEYRNLGDSDRELGDYLQIQARIEFLRTNFARAEALLEQAKPGDEEARTE